MSTIQELLISKANYWAFIALMMVGLFGVVTKKNLVKKVIGLNILQTSVILFFVSVGAKDGATIPIIEHGVHAAALAVQARGYVNPLPHVLMLTAIVVAVATLGVALALVVRIYQIHNTLEEDEIIEAMAGSGGVPASRTKGEP